MTTLDKLQRASYKGVPFLIDGDQDLEGGRKGQMHDYVNSDRRYFEDLGKRPEVFSISAIVHGDDSIDVANRLRRALDAKGAGTLVHPFWGSFTVTNGLYTVSTSTSSLGIIRFNMTFEVGSETEIFPTASLINPISIASLSTELSSLMQTDFGSIWNSVLDPIGATSAISKIDSVVDSFSSISSSVFPSVDNLNVFSDLLQELSDGKFSKIFSGIDLAQDLFGVFDKYKILADNASDQFTLSKSLFNFGEGEEPFIPTTLSRITREENRALLNATMQTNSLNQAYANSTQLEFKTNVDIENYRSDLEAQYEKISDGTSPFSSATLDKVKELRTEVRKYLDQEVKNVYRITEVSAKSQPMSIIAYNYYESTDEAESLIELNNTVDVSRVENEVDIFAT